MDSVVVKHFPSKKLKNPFVVQAVESLTENRKDFEKTYSANIMVYKNDVTGKINKLVIIGTKENCEKVIIQIE